MSLSPTRPDPYLGLLDDASHRTAVDARAEERGLRERASQLATWIGLLRDLAERGTAAAIRTTSRGVRRGALLAVGLDHVVVGLIDGGVALIALDEVSGVRPEPGRFAPPATGDRDHSDDRTLIEAIERSAGERDELAVGVRGAEELLRGELIGLGEDVLTLRLTGGHQGTVYLPVAAITEVLFAR